MKRTRQPRFELPPAAHEATRFGANVLAALENRDARDQGRRVALGPLHQTLAARREVVHDLGRVQAQPFEVDQVDVGALAGLEPAAVAEAKEIGGLAGLAFYDIFERQARAARPGAAQWVSMQVGALASTIIATCAPPSPSPSNVAGSVSIWRIGS